jgi:hypothetical protein
MRSELNPCTLSLSNNSRRLITDVGIIVLAVAIPSPLQLTFGAILAS